MNDGITHLKTHLLENALGRLTFLLLPIACALIAHGIASLTGVPLLGLGMTCMAFAVSGGVAAWTMLDDFAVCAVERVYELMLPVTFAIGVAAWLTRTETVLYAAGAIAFSGIGFLAGITPVTCRIIHDLPSPRFGVAALRGAAALQIIVTAGVVTLAEPLVAAGVGGVLFALCAALYAFRDHDVAAPVVTQ